MTPPRAIPLSLVLAAGLGPSGCYRSTSIEHAKLERLDYAGEERVRVHARGARPRTYEYDRVIVHGVGDEASQEFEQPVTARVQQGMLHITDAGGEQRMPLSDVQDIVIEEDAPGRPWVILATTAGAAVAGVQPLVPGRDGFFNEGGIPQGI